MYDGEFVDDLYQGYGVSFKWSDVSNFPGIEGRFLLYKGFWFEGKKSGDGIEYTEEGDEYEGQFKNGKRHGKGVLKYANGDVFEGQFEEGFMHGQGVLTKKNGDWFKGLYFKGKKNGRGELHFILTERRLEGVWKDNEFVCGCYYDEPTVDKYVKPDDLSGTTDGMIPVIELINPDQVVREAETRVGFLEKEEFLEEEEIIEKS